MLLLMLMMVISSPHGPPAFVSLHPHVDDDHLRTNLPSSHDLTMTMTTITMTMTMTMTIIINITITI